MVWEGWWWMDRVVPPPFILWHDASQGDSIVPSTLHSLARFCKSERASKLISLAILIVTVHTALARSLLQKRASELIALWLYLLARSLFLLRLHRGIHRNIISIIYPYMCICMCISDVLSFEHSKLYFMIGFN